jgi:hypothetical protein
MSIQVGIPFPEGWTSEDWESVWRISREHATKLIVGMGYTVHENEATCVLIEMVAGRVLLGQLTKEQVLSERSLQTSSCEKEPSLY